MKKTELSIKIWSIYLFILGLSMVIFPVATVGMFGYSGTGELWIRFVGILSVVLAMFYMQVARYRVQELYSWKIAGHVFGIVCMLTFLFSGIADGRIIGTIALELMACLWTLLALRSERKTTKLSAKIIKHKAA